MDIFLANAGPAKPTKSSKKTGVTTYVCVPNEPLAKEDLDRTVRSLCGRKGIPHPVVNPRGMVGFDRNMRIEVDLNRTKKTAKISASTKVFGRKTEEINTYQLYRKDVNSEFEEIAFSGSNTSHSRMCLFIVDDGVNSPSWIISDDRPPLNDSMDPIPIYLSAIMDDYNIRPIAQWSLYDDPDTEDNPFLIPNKILPEYEDDVKNGRSLLIMPTPTPPRLAEVSQIPCKKNEIFEQYKMTSTQKDLNSWSRAQVLVNAVTPLRDQSYVDEHEGNFIIAISPQKDGRDSHVDVEGMGIPMNRRLVEKCLLNIELCNQDGDTFVGRVTKDENVALMTAVLDKLPGTSFSMVSKDVLAIPEEETK